LSTKKKIKARGGGGALKQKLQIKKKWDSHTLWCPNFYSKRERGKGGNFTQEDEKNLILPQGGAGETLFEEKKKKKEEKRRKHRGPYPTLSQSKKRGERTLSRIQGNW